MSEDVFTSRVKDLETSAADIATKKQEGVCAWNKFNDATIDGTKSAEIKVLFARDAYYADYKDAIATSKSYKVTQIAKLKNDITSAIERDARMRYRSRIRMMAHALAKQVTHGDDGGPIIQDMLNYTLKLAQGS